MIFFACSRGECSRVRGSTHRKAHSNQHSLERRTVAVDFAPLLKPSSLGARLHMWKPTPLFMSLHSYPPCFMTSYAPVLPHPPPVEKPTPLLLSLLPSFHPKKSFAPASVVFALSPKNLIFILAFFLPLLSKYSSPLLLLLRCSHHTLPPKNFTPLCLCC